MLLHPFLDEMCHSIPHNLLKISQKSDHIMVHFDHFSAHINACKVLIRLWRNVRVTANQRNRQHFQMFFFSLEEVPAVVFRDFSEKKLFSAYFLMALDGIVRALLITHFFQSEWRSYKTSQPRRLRPLNSSRKKKEDPNRNQPSPTMIFIIITLYS